MKVKTINLKDVKTPKTVEEFRENLRKYYMCLGKDPKNLDELYIRGEHRVKIDELNSLDDLYKFDPEPYISPLVDLDGYEYKDKNYSIYESQRDFTDHGNPTWVKIDNQILREFYVKTLGDFSGFVTDKNSITEKENE